VQYGPARYVDGVARNEELLRSVYAAFNARDVEAVIEVMHPEVDWPNVWEGGRVAGPDAVREYWTRQFAAISGRVDPEGFTDEPDGATTVDVHQVVHDAQTSELISDSRVRHRYWFEDGLIVRMDVLEAPG
jgi:ketosteroid isomerase-like protein